MPKSKFSTVDIFAGQQLRLLRKRHNLTQASLGEIVGVTLQQIQKIESGHNRLGLSQAILVAQHFGVPLDYFAPPSRAKALRGDPGVSVPAEVDAVIAFALSKEGFLLMQSFKGIADKKVRNSVVLFAKSLARDEPKRPAKLRQKQR
jgi:transcriptional regulator with XRE-family HTH domain